MDSHLVPPTEERSDSVTTPTEAAREKKLNATVRRFKREGYRVTFPSQGEAIPDFLEGLQPDFIAESENDRVIVEVRPSPAVRGANDIKELAGRVSGHPGWRFELVTIPAVEPVRAKFDRRDLDQIAHQIRLMARNGHVVPAYFFGFAMIESILANIASHEGLDPQKKSAVEIARDLAFRGVISDETFDRIDRARRMRNQLAHAIPNTDEISPDSLDDLIEVIQNSILDSQATAAA